VLFLRTYYPSCTGVVIIDVPEKDMSDPVVDPVGDPVGMGSIVGAQAQQP
jgi:hypothetical protein